MTKQADALAAFLSNWSARSALSTTTPAANAATANQPRPQQRTSTRTPPAAPAPARPSGRTLRRRSSNYSYDTMPSGNDGTTESLPHTSRSPSPSSVFVLRKDKDVEVSSRSGGGYGGIDILSLNDIDISSLPRLPFGVGTRSLNGEQMRPPQQQQSSSTSNRALTSPPHPLGVGHPQVQQDGEALAARASPAGALGERPDSEAMKEG